MSTDYKNLFNKNKKKDYSNLFSNIEKEVPSTTTSNQESRMAYKNLFNDADKKEEPSTPEPKKAYNNLFGSSTNTPSEPAKSKIPVFPQEAPKRTSIPQRIVDPRVPVIQQIDAKISTHAVIEWIDNFDLKFKELSKVNQDLSQRELDLAMDFTGGRTSVQKLFTDIKITVGKLKGPEKKQGFISRLLSTPEEFKLTQDVITDVIQSIRVLLEVFARKSKYNTSMFVRSEMRKIETDISELKSELQCALVASQYLKSTDDFKAPALLEKVQKLSTLVDLSEIQLKNSYQLLEKDIDSYENLKNTTVPFLYIKIQSLMNSTLDTEVLNVINDIDKL
ncbi:hypothetical protein XaC1_433 [Xanthomonas phage XaC1]|nr:hypothetical protein XaC1_433 [Xanthomonas phage XaC1]